MESVADDSPKASSDDSPKGDTTFIIKYLEDGKYTFSLKMPRREDGVPDIEVACTGAFLRIVQEQDAEFIKECCEHFMKAKGAVDNVI